jgi:PAS domain S-box-containing protein
LDIKGNYKFFTLLAGAVSLVALGVVVSFWTFRQIEITSQNRAHTSDVLRRANDLLSSLKDAETGQRGYLLTGDEAFLEPYLAVRDNVSIQLEELRQLTVISAARNHVDALVPLVDAKLAHLARAIELYRNKEVTAAIETVRSGEGMRLMDSIRVEISSINQIEQEALTQHEAEFMANMRLLFIIISVTSVLILLLALSFAYLIYRETQQRLKNLVHLETQRFLEIQKETNKQLELVNATLRVSEEKLAVTLNSIGDAVIATDAAGLVALMNPLAEKLTGWMKADAIGRSVDEIFCILNEETRQPAVVPVAETLTYGTLHGLANHTTLIARDHSECSIADSCAPIRDHDGPVVGAILVFRDVTERTRLDRELHEKNVELESAKSVAEKASLAKSEFLSSMSHELRSPLNAILGFAQLMESDSPPPSPVQKQSIEQISQAGWHLLTLINEVLDLVKVESGQVTISPEPVSLSEVMLECRSMIELQARQRSIQLIFPHFDNPYFVRADRTRVKQVIINLLSNATKYNLERGVIEVTCNENAPGRIRVSIRDSGAGLSPQQLAQLFQAFNRLGQETSGVEGTGIGLVVAKRLVELMGGVIGVESAVGVGSVFWFELHAVSEPRLSVEADNIAISLKPHSLIGARLRTVLYVEDNPANLKLVEQIIARHPDLRLLTAVSGSSGIEVARNFQPDVILMDINLPDISGIEALKILSLDPSTARIPIVALSANAMPRDIKKGLEAGFFRYITKPIKINEFMDALNLAFDFAKVNTEENK